MTFEPYVDLHIKQETRSIIKFNLQDDKTSEYSVICPELMPLQEVSKTSAGNTEIRAGLNDRWEVLIELFWFSKPRVRIVPR
jgi:hypothetical protein